MKKKIINKIEKNWLIKYIFIIVYFFIRNSTGTAISLYTSPATFFSFPSFFPFFF